MVIFFIAFFPQFIHAADGSEVGLILVLGTISWSIGAICDLAFAYSSGAIGAWFHRRPRLQAAQPRVDGLAYLGLAWAPLTSSYSSA
jgi:threonine/homoserine/homoserine lactone efflux protein